MYGEHAHMRSFRKGMEVDLALSLSLNEYVNEWNIFHCPADIIFTFAGQSFCRVESYCSIQGAIQAIVTQIEQT